VTGSRLAPGMLSELVNAAQVLGRNTVVVAVGLVPMALTALTLTVYSWPPLRPITVQAVGLVAVGPGVVQVFVPL
jgi:hypothetical protein